MSLHVQIPHSRSFPGQETGFEPRRYHNVRGRANPEVELYLHVLEVRKGNMHLEQSFEAL